MKSGEWTHEQACEEFLMAFEGDDGNKDGKVTLTEFMDYHAGLSSNIDEDDAFGIMMAANWVCVSQPHPFYLFPFTLFFHHLLFLMQTND